MNDYSQTGEHSMLLEALKLIKNKNNWCVEFGAWDGYLYSNTRGLIEMGWKGVFIEGNEKKFKELKAKDKESICINSFVGIDEPLDWILDGIPKDFDILSIDIDGDDYWAWEDIYYYQPKIVIIEYNRTIPDSYRNPRGSQIGSSAIALNELALSKGYNFHSGNKGNLIFVHKKYLKKPNPLPDNKYTQVFFGYDGAVHYVGEKNLIWHDLPMKEQTLPKFLRKQISDYNLFEKLLFVLLYKRSDIFRLLKKKREEIPYHLRHK